MTVDLGATTKARLAAVTDAPESSASTWAQAVGALLNHLHNPATTPFGDSVELDVAPGPNRILVVEDDGKVSREALGGQGINRVLVEVQLKGEGNRVGKPELTHRIVGDVAVLELVLNLVEAPDPGSSVE